MVTYEDIRGVDFVYFLSKSVPLPPTSFQNKKGVEGAQSLRLQVHEGRACHGVRYWTWYVDDVLCIWRVTIDSLHIIS